MERLNNFLTKLKYYISPTLTVFLVIFGFIQIYFTLFVTPRSNDECLWIEKKVSEDSSYIYFYKVKQNGVTWEAGIRDGDIFQSINGQKIKDVRQASYIIDSLKSGKMANYTFSRDGKEYTTKVRMKKLINFPSLALEVYSLLWLIVGFIVYRSKPSSVVQSKFFNLGVFLVLYAGLSVLTIASTVPNPIMNEPKLIIIIGLTGTFASALIPSAIVELFLLFPLKFKIIEKRITSILLKSFSLLLILVYISLKFFINLEFLIKIEGMYYLAELIFSQIVRLSFIVSLVIGFITFTYSYFKIKIKAQRKPLTIILFAYLIGIFGLFYVSTLAQVFAETVFNSPEHYMPIILIALIPISFGYSIFRYSLMDVTEVVKNTVLYVLTSILLAGIYFFFIIFLGASIISVLGPEYQGLIIGIVFIMFVILFQSTKEKADEFLTKTFFPEKLAFREVLLKFDSEISGILNVNEILSKTGIIFKEKLDISAFGIGLVEKNILKFPLINGEQLFEGEISIDYNTIQEKVANQRKMTSNTMIEKVDFRTIFGKFGENLIENGIYTVFPLQTNNEILGFLFLGTKQKGSGFSDNEIEILTAVVNQISIAIKNTQYYENEKETLLLNIDLEKARNIQQNLLPNEMPKIAGFEIFGKMIPAKWVGGDYFDIIKISETKFYVVIGDVSGKGFSASFYMSRLQTMVQLLASQEISPKEMIIQLNKSMSKMLDKSYFITCSIALFDSESRKIKFVRAGHTPLKVNQNGEIINYLPKGLAIGLERNDDFIEKIEEIEIPLQNNSTYFFYSDGIEEEMNLENKNIGEEFIDEILRSGQNEKVEEIWQKIETQLSDFRQKSQQHDDITAVIVQYR